MRQMKRGHRPKPGRCYAQLLKFDEVVWQSCLCRRLHGCGKRTIIKPSTE
ncbi:hypothetical protein HMPREF9436_02270 [Faecalibacterium cf. prausnitzii KLE1255]|uniref:Uncharacterized protein n=1 Tax=Faecalibacterium cf. prausnitzii KLE1255 TaxID=748224 RepID=E2ZKR7_9FIRM|nr:hypothetical protein HMPREF9436_02270 [Faecalibacterium cf. prausnitzii KLE1255]